MRIRISNKMKEKMRKAKKMKKEKIQMEIWMKLIVSTKAAKKDNYSVRKMISIKN
jgi:hypothetical protein